MYSLTLGCGFLLACVYLMSAIAKLRNRGAFAAFSSWVKGLPLPGVRATGVAGGVVTAELLVAPLLLYPATRLAGYAVAGLLSAGFAVGTLVLYRGRGDVTCHCFGSSEVVVGLPHVMRNVALFVVAVVGAGIHLSTPAPSFSVSSAVAMCAGTVGALVFIFLDDIVSIFVEPGHARRSFTEDHP